MDTSSPHHSASSAGSAQSPDSGQPVKKVISTGFVFALGMEAGSLVDLLKNAKTTKGNGLVFHEGELGKHSVVLVETGIGQRNALKGTEAILDVFRPRQIISAGFAGALDPHLRKNELLQPSRILRITGETGKTEGSEKEEEAEESEKREQAVIDLSETWSDERGTNVGETGLHGKETKPVVSLLTVNQIVAKVAEKQELWQKTGANLVDMESYAIAEICRERNVPFRSVRIVLDTAEDELPGEIERLGQPDLTTARKVGAFFGMIFKRPSCVLDLYHFKERALIAADLLAGYLREQLG
ncbi:MAG: hypothetical protein ACRC10_03135 [Thermoguttaceae bacterium]